MKFKASVIPSGNATAVEVPEVVTQSLGSGARPPVRITINGHTWRSRIAVMRGSSLIGISASNREASGIKLGELIEITVDLDSEPRVVELPADLAAAFSASKKLRATVESLPFGLKRKHVATIEDSKSETTRQRRIDKLVAELQDSAA